MKHTLRIGRLLLCASLIMLWGCDDTAPGTTADTGTGGTGGSGDMGEGGTGGMGGMMATPCARDDQCPDGQYCQPPADGMGAGMCVDGCRTDPDSCPEGRMCDAAMRMCVDEPCAGDDACDAGQYCNADGACVDGCREGDDCGEPDALGRESVCNVETRACEPQFPCCNADDTCAEMLASACAEGGGQVIDAIGTCERDPCGPDCEIDSDCPPEQYCNTEDGRCADGCRLEEPELLCLESEYCDPDKHTCELLACMSDADCPDDRYCDDGGLCVIGCREDPNNCPDGLQCVDHECIEQCDPRDPEGCGPGQYCDPPTLTCYDDCFEHAECDEDRYCEVESNRCIRGCRDDEGELGEPNNDFETATPIDLVPNEGGRIGQIDGRIICGDDPDFYVVELLAGERLRVDLEYGPDAGNLDMRLHGDEVEDGPIQAATLEVPERIEYPAIGVVVQRPATYYIEVHPPGNDPLRRAEYRVTVSVVDAGASCFADEAEPEDDQRAGATVVADRGERFTRTLCQGDVDHFRLDLSPNDALQIQMTVEPGDAEIEAALFPSTLNAAQARIRLNQANGFQYRAELNEGAFVGSDEWYLQVVGANDDVVGEYEVQIVRESADICGDDGGTEPNDTLEEAVLLDEFALDMPYEVPYETDICTVGDPDVDTFCFVAEMGETIEAWTVSPAAAVNGDLAIQFVDARGVFSGREGRGVEEGEMSQPARVINVVPGNWCVQVSGLDGAQGPYQLFVQRLSPADGVCANDVAEEAGRNDRPATATDLVDVDGDGRRWEYLEGYICDIGAEGDEDWYSFNVAQPGSSLCVMIDDFDRARADVDLDVFPSEGTDGGTACQRASDCDRGRAACITRRCTPPLEVSASSSVDFEMVNLRRPFVGDRQGDFLLRVGHDDPNEGPYQVAVTVTPTEECGPDWQEVGNNNDDMARAIALGAGERGICDTWICGDERNTGDWYAIEVPQGQDRTVIINYSGGVEGRLVLNAVAPDLPDDMGSGEATSNLAAGNHQCINIRGGNDAAPVLFQVEANQFLDDERIDYSLQVVPTDLDANPEGECEALGAANFDPCPPRAEWDELFGRRVQPQNCWVAVPLP